MIKLPEPSEYIWEPDGTFNIGQERGLSPNAGPCNGWKISPIYTEAQLKQYGRDVLEEATKVCRQTCSAENNVFGDGYNTGAYQCEKNLCALIKEIE